MLKNCWRKVYIFCKCHPTCFFRHAGSFILSFNVKSEMATDMLLSVILSELVDSDDENTRRGKTLKWIRFLRPFFFFCFLCTLSLICLPFLLSSTSSAASFYSSPFCSCNLDRWPESSLLLFKLISIWSAWFFYCYYFAKRFSFVESFEIRSSNIRNNVIKMEFCMKQEVNRSNMKIVLDESESVVWKICFQSNFHPTRFFFSQHDFFFFCYFCVPLKESSNETLSIFRRNANTKD